MKTMSIYEPAMCCETGICGVSVDPELLRVSAVLNLLKKGGAEVKRMNLSGAPGAFVENETVRRFLEEQGEQGLPVVLVEGEMVLSGRYPTNEEFLRLLDLPESVLCESGTDCGCAGGCC